MQEPLQELLGKLQDWWIELVKLLPNMVIAVVVLVLAAYVAGVVRKLVFRGMERLSGYPTLNNLAATIARLLILAVGTFAALSIIGLDRAVTTMLAGAGIIGLAIAFAFQDLTANFISGILLIIRRPFRIGEMIESHGYLGYLEEVNLRATHLKTLQGQIVVLPNKDVIGKPLVNFSRSGFRRIDLQCMTSYDYDLEEVKRVGLDAIQSIPYLAKDMPVDFWYSSFEEKEIRFEIHYWVPFSKQPHFLAARSDGISYLNKAFVEAGLPIPYPINLVELTGEKND